MNPSYFRIQLPLNDASSRFAAWIGLPELQPARKMASSDAIAGSCDGGVWRGTGFFVHEFDGWTIFDDLSGCLSFGTAEQWLRLAGQEPLVFAAYNDAICYGELFVVQGGKVAREFLDCADAPETNSDSGRLDFEASSPIKSWIEVATFVDEDKLSDAGVPEGVLQLFGGR